MPHQKTITERTINLNTTLTRKDEDIRQNSNANSHSQEVIHHDMSKSCTALTENSANATFVINLRSTFNSNYPVMDALKPILCLLKVFGLYYSYATLHRDKTVNASIGDNCQTLVLNNCQLPNKSSKGAMFTPLRVYTLAVCLLLWFNVGRLLSTLPIYYNTSWMPFTVLSIFWSLQLTSNATLLFYMCHHKMPTFINHINKTQDNENPEFLPNIARYTRKRCIFYLILSTFYVAMISSIIIFFQFSPFSELKATMSVLVSPFQNTTIFPYLYIFAIHIYCSAAWVYPIAFFCLCCIMVTQKFHTLTKRFKKAITGNHDVSQIISIYRKQHEMYCVTTELLSDAFSLFIAQAYTIYIAIACFTLYRLLFNWVSNGLVLNVTLMIWLVSTLGLMLLISYVASNLNQEV